MKSRTPPEADAVNSRVFEEALALPAPSRAQFLNAACSTPSEAARILSILTQIDKLGSFLELNQAPIENAAFLKAGDSLGNRFRIVKLAGVGGMGEVYCAFDELQDSKVALKICRGSWWTNEDLLSRLKEEVRLACRISHRNVCRIHSLFSEAVEVRAPLFLTMEWFEGSTLANFLERRELIAPEQCLTILAGVADGLKAIHDAGIIHRDLKPSNILLVHDEDGSQRSVITDFGLACDCNQMIEGSGSGGVAQLAGTPEYMAPEQFLGEPLTQATDVYALGLIAFELLTGAKPFPAGNVFQTAIHRMKGAPPGRHLRGLHVGDSHQLVFNRALCEDPLKRYKDPRAFVRDLSGELPRIQVSRRIVVSGGFFSAVVALFAVIARFPGRRAFYTRNSALIMITETTCAEESDVKLSAHIATRLLRAQLAQSGHVSVLAESQVESTWRRVKAAAPADKMPEVLSEEMARDIALRSGSPFVIFSSLAKNHGELALLVRLERLNGSTIAADASVRKEFYSAVPSDLPETVSGAARWIRDTCGESARDLNERNRASSELTTASWEALKEYARGDSEWANNRPGPAILHLKGALYIDPDFAAAAIRLADILAANGQTDDAYAQYGNAAKILTARNLTDRESLMARGKLALDVGLSRQALDVFQRYALEFPEDPLPHFYQAGPLSSLRRPSEALRQLSKAIEMSPSTYAFVIGRCRYFLEQGNLSAASRDLDAAKQLNSNDWTDQHAMALAFAAGDDKATESAIRALRIRGSLEFQSKSYALESCLRAERGDLSRAAAALYDGLRFDSGQSVPASYQMIKRRLLAQVFLLRGDLKNAKQVCRELAGEQMGREFRLQIAVLLAEIGETREAARVACQDGACASPIERDWPIYQYWRRRFEFAMAMRGKAALNAFRTLVASPEPPDRHTFPGHLIQAASAWHDPAAIETLSQLWKAGPGRWWLEPERNPPGIWRLTQKAVTEVKTKTQ